jgi:hypothetical protein
VVHTQLAEGKLEGVVVAEQVARGGHVPVPKAHTKQKSESWADFFLLPVGLENTPSFGVWAAGGFFCDSFSPFPGSLLW